MLKVGDLVVVEKHGPFGAIGQVIRLANDYTGDVLVLIRGVRPEQVWCQPTGKFISDALIVRKVK